MASRWGFRLLGSLVALGLLCAGLEWLARHRGWDYRDAQVTLIDPGLTSRYGDEARALGIEYVPRGFVLDEGGFTTGWGRCDWEHGGETLLVLGDSTTRMVGGVPAERGGMDDLPALSWPGVLSEWLRPGARICVFAEDGYHPADYVPLLDALEPRLQPTTTVVLLCPNDLVERRTRRVEDTADGIALVEESPAFPMVPALGWRWLHERSVAFRSLHRSLEARGIAAESIRNDQVEVVQAGSYLRRLGTRGEAIQFWYLPWLGGEGDGNRAGPGGGAPGIPGVKIRPVDLPEPLEWWRRNPKDPRHLNWYGHREVARRIGAGLPGMIDVPPESELPAY